MHDRMKGDHTFTSMVRDETFWQGPVNLVGPIRYSPFGIIRLTMPADLHAAFQAARNA